MSEVTLIARPVAPPAASPAGACGPRARSRPCCTGTAWRRSASRSTGASCATPSPGRPASNALVNLDVDGVTHPTIVKSLQRDPIKRNVSHIDFIVVRLDEVIEISVAFHLEGEAKAVLAEGGLVDPAVDTITVRTTPRNVPGAFIYDVSACGGRRHPRRRAHHARGRRAGRRPGDGHRDRAGRSGREGRGARRGRGGRRGRGRRGRRGRSGCRGRSTSEGDASAE